MLRESDNTSADALTAAIGGTEAVRDRLAALGVEGVDVSRTEGRMLSDWAGVPPPPAGRDWSGSEFRRLLDAVGPEARRRAAEAWAADPRDSATPAGMAELLARVHEGAGLSAAGRRLLIGHMERSYGASRIPGLLPPGTRAARKSGTVGATTNDVGIVSLPDGTHMALAVFIKSSGRPLEERERAIAGASRALYDHFTGFRRWGILRIYL
jgi:beta-lactamase class A